MDFFEAVAARGSYRGEFLEEAVPQADLEKILEAGLRAPSGYNNQTTTFLVVTDKALLSKIAEWKPAPATSTAPVVIVALSEFWQAENGLSFELEDYAAATENVMLAITAAGYAGVWMDGAVKLDGLAGQLAALLDIPQNFCVRAIIPMGKPRGKVAQKDKKPFGERVKFNGFQCCNVE